MICRKGKLTSIALWSFNVPYTWLQYISIQILFNKVPLIGVHMVGHVINIGIITLCAFVVFNGRAFFSSKHIYVWMNYNKRRTYMKSDSFSGKVHCFKSTELLNVFNLSQIMTDKELNSRNKILDVIWGCCWRVIESVEVWQL